MTMRRGVAVGILVIISLIVIARLTAEKPITVRTQAVEVGLVEFTVANTRAGTVKACRRAKLAPTMGGRVAQLNVSEGRHVRKDQLLLELWNDDLRAQLLLSQQELNAAHASAREVCILGDMLAREAERLQELRDKKLISEDELDRAATKAKAKHIACAAAQAQSEVSAAKIAVAEAALERTRIRAPFSGTVAEVNAELGEFVTPSPPGILTLPAIDLIDTQCLYIEAPIDEVDAPAIAPGMTARVSLDAFRDRHFSAQVTRVAPYVLEREKQARTVAIDVTFTQTDELTGLLPGFSADIEIILEKRPRALRIPTESILDNKRVYVYHPDDKRLEERIIETGLSNWKFTEVLSGIKEGEHIVTNIEKEGVSDGAYAVVDESQRD